MDYCATCRRYVNGALACPGCGTYALSADPSAGHPGPAGSAAPDPLPYQAPQAAEETTTAEIPAATSEAAAFGALPATGGRAARRRQLARLKKYRRRAVTATAFALFGGGLTLAAMPHAGSARHGTPAAAPLTIDPVGSPTGDTGASPAESLAPATPQPTRPVVQASLTQATVAGAAHTSHPATGSGTAAGGAAQPGATAVAPVTNAVHGAAAAPTQAATTATTAASTAPSAPATAAPTTSATGGSSSGSGSGTTAPPLQVCVLGLCVG